MTPNHLELKSADGTKLNLEALYQIAPSCFTEVKDEKTGELRHVVNFTTLRQLLGDDAVDDAPEMYQFTWPGKQEARREAARPITDTLRPCPEESVDWDTTQNLYIEGDNLAVLKLLQKGYMGKVKMIFIDPPYNTGTDFIYHDNFVATQQEMDLFSGDVDEEGNRYRKNTDSNGRFHSDWCSMMYSRLTIARSLLAEDGGIFISIDYNEFDNLKKIMDEVFGEANFQREIIWRIGWLSGYKTTAPNFIRNHDTILFYSKNADVMNFNKKYIENKDFKEIVKKEPKICGKLTELGLSKNQQDELLEFINHTNRPERYPIEDTWNANEYDDLNSIAIVSFSGEKISKILDIDQDFKGQKSVKMLKRIIESMVPKDGIILDFFSGTASTAHAVMQLNYEDQGSRQFIMVQLPEESPVDSEAYKVGYKTICEIGKERIRRIGCKMKEDVGILAQCLDTGFRVFKIADSNFNNIEFTPKEFTQDLLSGLESNIKEGRTDLDLLFGAMLDWGVQLSLPMSKETVNGCDIYTVNEGDLVACFSENITENVVSAMAAKMPLRVLFRDSCFSEDKAKINVFELFKQKLDWGEDEAIKNIRVI